jgi:hypothetical protein
LYVFGIIPGWKAEQMLFLRIGGLAHEKRRVVKFSKALLIA